VAIGRAGKGALAPCPPSIRRVVVSDGHAGLCRPYSPEPIKIVIARSVSDDPSSLPAQAPQGGSPPKRLSAKAEAIQSLARASGLLRGACHRARISRDPLARNDGWHTFAFSRPVFARVLQIRLRLFEQRAQGMPGARCTRGLVCQRLRIWRTRAYRAAETLRHPLRNGFTAYFVLSPVSGLCCHRHP
jgi:hypothetical protein